MSGGRPVHSSDDFIKSYFLNGVDITYDMLKLKRSQIRTINCRGRAKGKV